MIVRVIWSVPKGNHSLQYLTFKFQVRYACRNSLAELPLPYLRKPITRTNLSFALVLRTLLGNGIPCANQDCNLNALEASSTDLEIPLLMMRPTNQLLGQLSSSCSASLP